MHDHKQYDPVFLNSRREAIIIFASWIVAFAWTIPYCFWMGYPNVRAGDSVQVQTVLGFPSWLFWGVFAPWMAANVFTIWFCFFQMKDDPLGEEISQGDASSVAISERTVRNQEERPDV